MIKIKKINVESLDRLHEIDKNNFSDAWTYEMMKSELENANALYFGLFNDDEIIGFCGGWYVAGEYQINKVVIDFPHQNKKLGQIFFTYVLEQVKLMGANIATVEVRESNHAAIKVYTKAGLDVVSKRENYYANNKENAYVLTRNFKDER